MAKQGNEYLIPVPEGEFQQVEQFARGLMSKLVSTEMMPESSKELIEPAKLFNNPEVVYAELGRMVKGKGDVQFARDKTIAVSKLNGLVEIPEHKLDRAQVEKAKAKYKTDGKFEPITFTYDPKNGLGVLTDGHHRLQAAKELGVTRIPVEINRAYAKYDAGRYPEGFAKQVGKPGQEIKYLSELLEPDVQFARASAGAFDFGMREVQNGKLIRPGQPPLGTKDGWMTELEFRVNGGEFGPLQKDEVAFYKQLVPEAFANDKVHLQKLWDGLS